MCIYIYISIDIYIYVSIHVYYFNFLLIVFQPVTPGGSDGGPQGVKSMSDDEDDGEGYQHAVTADDDYVSDGGEVEREEVQQEVEDDDDEVEREMIDRSVDQDSDAEMIESGNESYRHTGQDVHASEERSPVSPMSVERGSSVDAQEHSEFPTSQSPASPVARSAPMSPSEEQMSKHRGLEPHSPGSPASPTGSGPQSPTGSGGPYSPAGSGGPYSPAGSNPQSPTGSGPQSPTGSGPQSPTGSGPQSPTGSGPQSPTGSAPQSPAGSGPQSPDAPQYSPTGDLITVCCSCVWGQIDDSCC